MVLHAKKHAILHNFLLKESLLKVAKEEFNGFHKLLQACGRCFYAEFQYIVNLEGDIRWKSDEDAAGVWHKEA